MPYAHIHNTLYGHTILTVAHLFFIQFRISKYPCVNDNTIYQLSTRNHEYDDFLWIWHLGPQMELVARLSPKGLESQNSTKQLAHWVELLGQIFKALPRKSKSCFGNFEAQKPFNKKELENAVK